MHRYFIRCLSTNEQHAFGIYIVSAHKTDFKVGRALHGNVLYAAIRTLAGMKRGKLLVIYLFCMCDISCWLCLTTGRGKLTSSKGTAVSYVFVIH